MCVDGWETPLCLPQAYSYSSPKITTLSVGAGIVLAWSLVLPLVTLSSHRNWLVVLWQHVPDAQVCQGHTVNFWSHVAVVTHSFELCTVSVTSVPAHFGDAFISLFQLGFLYLGFLGILGFLYLECGIWLRPAQLEILSCSPTPSFLYMTHVI